MLFRLAAPLVFPDPREAEPDGLLAVGGDLSPARLLQAYSQGIFPWFNEGDPLLWWSPPSRCVVLRGQEHRSRSLQRVIRSGRFEVRFDTAFEAVMRACAQPREGQDGTWISEAMVEAYTALHRAGYAHSVETWEAPPPRAEEASGSPGLDALGVRRRDGRLVGGLYGLSLGAAFFGESMFSQEADASKVAFAALCDRCWAWDFAFIDAQVETPHLRSLGAQMLDRDTFLAHLRAALQAPTRVGAWT